MTNQDLKFKIEQEIANLLISRLENAQITPERASEIAKFVMESIPDNATDDYMINLIPKLDDRFSELSSVVFDHMQETDDSIKNEKLEEVKIKLKQYLQEKI